MGATQEGVLNPRGIFSEEGSRSLSRSRSDMDERGSISQMSYHNANPRKRKGMKYI